jgi:hypothetical protein
MNDAQTHVGPCHAYLGLVISTCFFEAFSHELKARVTISLTINIKGVLYISKNVLYFFLVFMFNACHILILFKVFENKDNLMIELIELLFLSNNQHMELNIFN